MSDKNMSVFNIYYLNFSKVYELSMMIDNVIVSSIQRENSSELERSTKRNANISANFGINSRNYLAGIKSVTGSETSERNSNSSKMIESLDVKTTKSILLRQIVEKCSSIIPFSSNEGNKNSNEIGMLVKLDKIKLKILNENNLRQIQMLRKDALKGFHVEGMDVNNIISSILQDYSYVLYGTLSSGNKVIIKIPMEIEDEFESKYSIDDLLIGEVSIIGVYKGIVTEQFITTNMFDYLSEIGSQQTTPEEKVFQSSTIENTTSNLSKTGNNDEYCFIDVIAIIQDVSFHTKEKEAVPIKLTWYQRLLRWIKGIFNG